MLGVALLATALGALIAFVNGANDVSKSIATLVGSGTTTYRRALAWATVWTGFGAISGAWLAGAMVQTFGGGFLVAGTVPTFAAAVAVMSGASVWVLLATRIGAPVSTTHALLGSLAGVALVAYGPRAVGWGTVLRNFVVPLVASPLVALATMSALVRARRRMPAADCACVSMEPASVAVGMAGQGAPLTSTLLQLRWTMGSTAECAAGPRQALKVRLEHLHWLTSGATSFARALNDAPKIVALVLGAWALSDGAAQSRAMPFLVVAVAMVAGCIVGGRRVTSVLAEKITPMDHCEGFLANATTAALVGAGAVFGLPMSTTHVASAAIVGIGVNGAAGRINRRTVRDMLLAWLITLPVSAVFGIGAFEVASYCGLG